MSASDEFATWVGEADGRFVAALFVGGLGATVTQARTHSDESSAEAMSIGSCRGDDTPSMAKSDPFAD